MKRTQGTAAGDHLRVSAFWGETRQENGCAQGRLCANSTQQAARKAGGRAACYTPTSCGGGAKQGTKAHLQD